MALNDVTFVKSTSGLGRPLANQDNYSGFIVASTSYPSGFSSGNKILKFNSISDAVTAGIDKTYSDEVQATGTYTVTAIGSNADTVTLSNTYAGVTVVLGTYTKVSGDSSTTLVATGIATAINAGTATHGFTAVGAVAVVTITAPKGTGVKLNTGSPITAVYNGGATLAGTIAQFSGGVGSQRAVWWYHINEFFKIQPQGNLWFMVSGSASFSDFSELTTLQNFANGTLRQCAIYSNSAFATSQMTTIQGIAAALETNHKMVQVMYAADITGTTLSALTDLTLLNNPRVSHIIAQDGAAVGADLYLQTGKSVTAIGNELGTVALSGVNECIAWVGKFNASDGVENDTAAFANGTLYRTVSDSILTALDSYGYIFFRKFSDYAGTFWNNSYTAVSATSDYRTIENNRTMDKAERGIRSFVIPYTASPVYVNADGTLTQDTIDFFTQLSNRPLEQMERDGELSAHKAIIDPTQNIASNSKLQITIQEVPVGVARQINFNIGFVKKIS